MTDVPRLHRVTRIRGELALSPSVTRVVKGFFEQPDLAETDKLYTTAQVVVDQNEYHQHYHDRQLHEVERLLSARRMASQIFRIGPTLRLYEGSGMGRLQFSVHPDDRPGLTQFREQLAKIHGLEPIPADDMVYLELSKRALANDVTKWQTQRDETLARLASMMRHPTASAGLTVSRFQIVTKDMARRMTAEPDVV